MCDRLQMDSARASSSEQTDITEKAIGFDAYNQSVTGGVTKTLSNRATDSDHTPIVFTLKVRGGCEVDSKGKKAGKGPLVQENLSATLGVSQDQTLFVPKFLNSSGGWYIRMP